MNFETMHRQRKWILLSAALGIIGIFLPWTKGLINFLGQSANNNGFFGSGIVVFFCFVIGGALSLMGDQTKTLNRTNWMITLILGFIGFLIMIIKFFSTLDQLSIVGFGFYITEAASICLVYSAYTYRSTGDTLQGGFDSLKGTIAAKTATTPATPAPPSQVGTPVNTTTTASTTTVVTPPPTPTTDANKPVA